MSNSCNLKGRVAIVTGSARGIGASCAYALAREGAHIVIVDIIEADEIMSEIQIAFPNVEIVFEKADIRNRKEVKRVIDNTINRWGKIDILVNNAGTCSRLDLEKMTDEDWDRDMNTNLRGTFLFTQLAIYPHMVNQGYGKIINISSISGIIGGLLSYEKGVRKGRSGPAYAASKGGIIAFTKWVAKEVGEHGIYCNSVAPGSVKTEITKGMNYPLDSQPIKRMGDPQDIAEAVVYLASPTSNYITGQVIKVCGGMAIG